MLRMFFSLLWTFLTVLFAKESILLALYHYDITLVVSYAAIATVFFVATLVTTDELEWDPKNFWVHMAFFIGIEVVAVATVFITTDLLYAVKAGVLSSLALALFWQVTHKPVEKKEYRLVNVLEEKGMSFFSIPVEKWRDVICNPILHEDSLLFQMLARELERISLSEALRRLYLHNWRFLPSNTFVRENVPYEVIDKRNGYITKIWEENGSFQVGTTNPALIGEFSKYSNNGLD